MSDPLRPANSRAWTRVSFDRAWKLLYTPGYEVQFERFIGGKGWQSMTNTTPHECRTAYRARSLNSA